MILSRSGWWMTSSRSVRRLLAIDFSPCEQSATRELHFDPCARKRRSNKAQG